MLSSVDPDSGIEIIGEVLPYTDGAENELLGIFEAAEDCSARSDELIEAIHDWPTKYHLSAERVNLLEPLEITANMRILDVGAGTGVNARWLGEQGADVTALEGSLDRATAAQARCEGLSNVKVVAGSVHDYEDEEGFDLICCIGVLEYASAEIGGAKGQQAFLSKLRSLLKPEGDLVVAIENQLGLKYLLGYGEDHLQMPMIGIEDYPGDRTVRTFSRMALRNLLAAHGFAQQRWLYPYPDYKLPTAILSEEIFNRADAEDLVDQLIRKPVRDDMDARVFVSDERRSHASFIRAGLGRDISSSFLVIAGATPTALVSKTTLAWLFTSGRLRNWSLKRALRTDSDVLTMSTGSLGEQQASDWLSQEQTATRSFVLGKTVEQLVRNAWALDNEAHGFKFLKAWAAHVRKRATEPGGGSSAFNTSGTGLPNNWLDIGPSNFVNDGTTLHYIDSEWETDGAVDTDLALFRGVWFFAQDLIMGNAPTPFAGDSVDEMAIRVATEIGIEEASDLLLKWRDAEADLQSRIRGNSIPAHLEGLKQSGSSWPLNRASNAVSNLAEEVASLREETARLHHEVASAHQDLEKWHRRWRRLTWFLPTKLLRRLLRRK